MACMYIYNTQDNLIQMKICNKKYPEENESIFGESFKIFDYPLSDFQKYSIEAIVTGNHALICVPTGNGKTLPAEFAIQYFSGLIGPGQGSKKKVIYTSPIKALSNQKYYDFGSTFNFFYVLYRAVIV